MGLSHATFRIDLDASIAPGSRTVNIRVGSRITVNVQSIAVFVRPAAQSAAPALLITQTVPRSLPGYAPLRLPMPKRSLMISCSRGVRHAGPGLLSSSAGPSLYHPAAMRPRVCNENISRGPFILSREGFQRNSVLQYLLQLINMPRGKAHCFGKR